MCCANDIYYTAHQYGRGRRRGGRTPPALEEALHLQVVVAAASLLEGRVGEGKVISEERVPPEILVETAPPSARSPPTAGWSAVMSRSR